MKKISILHATRRPNAAFMACMQWLQNASHNTPIEYILSVDESDSGNYDFTDTIEFGGFRVIKNNNRSAIDAFNRAAEVATGDLFVCISDDMACFQDWDINLLLVVGDNKDFYLKVKDGIQPVLVTMPIFDREYYNRLGYVWFDGYSHLFCDQEATAVAIMIGRYYQADLLFPHNHHTVGKFQFDEVSAKNDATWIQGQNLFNHRLKTNFGLAPEQIVKRYEDIVWR